MGIFHSKAIECLNKKKKKKSQKAETLLYVECKRLASASRTHTEQSKEWKNGKKQFKILLKITIIKANT